jgi:hypothetical protein
MEHQADAPRNRATLGRMMNIVSTGDYDALEEVLDPGFVQEIPQSGERVVGIENFRKTLQNLPGGGTSMSISDDPHIAGDQEHYVMTPTFTVVKLEGTGDELTSYVRVTYPDGSDWYIVSFSSYRDGKMTKRVDFFAPFFDPPEWRAQWVERL